MIAGLSRERDDAGHELGENAIAAHRFVAGMERRELDRDAGALRQRLVAGGPSIAAMAAAQDSK